jgi:hypothetical protein
MGISTPNTLGLIFLIGTPILLASICVIAIVLLCFKLAGKKRPNPWLIYAGIPALIFLLASFFAL